MEISIGGCWRAVWAGGGVPLRAVPRRHRTGSRRNRDSKRRPEAHVSWGCERVVCKKGWVGVGAVQGRAREQGRALVHVGIGVRKRA
jgi:hypothetical protein